MPHEIAIVVPFFNPCRYENRLRSCLRCLDPLRRSGLPIWTVEASIDGQFQLPDSEHSLRLRMPAQGWVWQKERLLNQFVRQLPHEVTKVAWIDGDILFEDPDWPRKASEALDAFPVVQLFDHVFWLGPDDQPLRWKKTGSKRPGLAFLVNEVPRLAREFDLLSPGFAWAARRDFLEQVGLYENDITGGNDTFMALGMFGWFDHPFLNLVAPALVEDALRWGRRAFDFVDGKVGYLAAPISHLWHGAYSDRGYVTKQKRLTELGFDPVRDLTTDPESGLMCWSDRAGEDLKRFIVDYFHSRKEDDMRVTRFADGD